MYRIIIALILFCLLLACSDNPPLRSRYQAEKSLHEAEAKLERVTYAAPHTQDEALFNVLDDYNRITAFCFSELKTFSKASHPKEFDELSSLAYKSANRAAQIYFSLNYFDSCQAIYSRILSELTLPPQQKMTAYINLGQSFQSGGLWDQAYKTYGDIIKSYYPPVDGAGEIFQPVFTLPYHIYNISKSYSDSNQAETDFANSIRYYEKLITDFPNTKLARTAQRQLALMYEITQQWQKELVALEKSLNPDEEDYQVLLLKIADIYAAQLQRPDTATALYDYLLELSDPADSMFTPTIHLKKALLLLNENEPIKARELLSDLKKQYPEYYAMNPITQYSLGRTYELENRWGRAESEFNLLIEKYKGSQEALSTILYIYDHYVEEKDELQIERWFETAERHYRELALQYKGKIMEAIALIYLADLKTRIKAYQESADILTEVYNKYPNTEPGQKALLQAIAMYNGTLENPQVADSLLTTLRDAVIRSKKQVGKSDLLR